MKRHAYPDDPLQAAMWAGFIRWAYSGEDEFASGIRQQYEHETGRKVYQPRSGIEGLVDKATGYHTAAIEHFMDWLNRSHWGEDPFTGKPFDEAA